MAPDPKQSKVVFSVNEEDIKKSGENSVMSNAKGSQISVREDYLENFKNDFNEVAKNAKLSKNKGEVNYVPAAAQQIAKNEAEFFLQPP